MPNNYEKQYLSILEELLTKGKLSSNRTGIKTYKLWGRQIHIDLQEGFPALTTKKLHWKSIVHELLWMISGDTNIQYLLKNGVTFWSEWPYQRYFDKSSEYLEKYPSNLNQAILSIKDFEKKIVENDIFAQTWGSIGNFGYGRLWRDFPVNSYEDRDGGRHKILGIDQVHGVLEELKANPDSRRIIISAWHPYHSNRKEDALLPACHNYVQFGTELLNNGQRQLNCYFNMRSSDGFLGLPYNCAFYALFTHLIANQLNMVSGQLVYSAADVHLYENHIEQAKIQLTRTPKGLPKLIVKAPGKSIFDIKFEDLELTNYNPEPNIKAEVAI